MSSFVRRFRQARAAGRAGDDTRPEAAGPASLLSVRPLPQDEPRSSPTIETEPALGDHVEPAQIEEPVRPRAPTPLMAALSRKEAPRRRLPFLGGAKETILDASPSLRARMQVDGDLAGRLEDAQPIADERPDMAESVPVAPDLAQAERQLGLAVSTVRNLANDIAGCNAALEDARRLIRAEELKLARLRGQREALMGEAESENDGLDTIERALADLSRTVERLDRRSPPARRDD